MTNPALSRWLLPWLMLLTVCLGALHWAKTAPPANLSLAADALTAHTRNALTHQGNLGFDNKDASGASVVTKGGMKVADDAFSHSYTYADRVRVRAVQDPVSHNFPYSFDDGILATKPIPKANGYNIYQKPGTMNDKTGVFEIGVTKDGVIDHRFFRPDK